MDNQTQALIDALESAGRKWRPYSGRGMYGKECVSVMLEDAGELFIIGGELADSGFAVKPTIDSMGLGVVAYWPRCRIDSRA